MSDSYTILCGDIGGTNTRFQAYEVSSISSPLPVHCATPGVLRVSRKYLNSEFASFEGVLQKFALELQELNVVPPVVVCMAVAGPVHDNSATLTNRSWLIDSTTIQRIFSHSKTIHIINDFVAQGYGVLTLNHENECTIINQGKKQTNNERVQYNSGPIAVVGAGTGLGECYLTCNEGDEEYTCFPTEGDRKSVV